MRLHSFKLLAMGGVVFALMNNAQAAGESCSQVFAGTPDLAASSAFPQDAVSLARVQAEIANSKKAANFFMSAIKKQSDAFKAQNAGRIIELDFLCLGAGPQCAAASLVAGRTSNRSAVLEATDMVGKTFAEKDFFINSEEQGNLTMHQFPGGVGSLADHTSGQYAHSSQLAAYIQEQQYVSNVPVLLNTRLTDLRLLRQPGGPFIWEIKTDNGLTIHTRNFGGGTGLGSVGTKVRDPGYQAAFNQAYQDHLAHQDVLQRIMSTDTIGVALKKIRDSGKRVRLPQRLIIIGDGDGSRISIEGLRASGIDLPKGFHITWIGNNFQTAAEYLVSQQGDPRYVHNIVPFYHAGQLSGVNAYVQAWRVDAKGVFHLMTADKQTRALKEVSGDLIIDATGYEATIPKLLAMFGAKLQMADVSGPLPELGLESTVLARQAVMPNGELVPFMAYGAAAGMLATPAELASSPNPNQVAIFNTVARTSMAVSRLLGVTPYPSNRGARESRGATIPAEKIIQRAQERLQDQQRAVTSGIRRGA